jgi:hypothetical protein
VEETDPGIADCLNDERPFVFGPVVDNDDFHVLNRLAQNGPDGTGNRPGIVVQRNDH